MEQMDGDRIASTASLNRTKGFNGSAEISVWNVLEIKLPRIDDLLLLTDGTYQVCSDIFSDSGPELDDDHKDPNYDATTSSNSDSGSDSDTIYDSSSENNSASKEDISNVKLQMGPNIPTYPINDAMDKRISSFSSHWEKVQSSMASVLNVASQDYLVTRQGKLTSSNETFGLMCLTAGDDLKRKGELLESAGLKMLGNVEKKSRMCAVDGAEVQPIMATVNRGRAPPPLFSRPVKRHLGLWICTVCNIGYMSKASMEDCYRRHEGEKLVCSVCEQSFNTERTLRNHLDSHVDGPYLCNNCGKEFKTKSGRNRCIRKHAQPKGQYLCHICGKKYDVQESLKDHVNAHSSTRKYKCPKCGKKYKNSNTKRQHLHKVHTKKALYGK